MDYSDTTDIDPTGDTIRRYIANAAALGHETHTVALAARISGIAADSLCLWCLYREDPHGTRSVFAVPKGGDCLHCSYSGYDCRVVL